MILPKAHSALFLCLLNAAPNELARDERMPVEVAVARYVRATYRNARLAFDSRSRAFDASGSTDSISQVAYRTPEHVAQLVAEARAPLVRFPDVTFCVRSMVPNCAETIFRIGVPVVTGDTASVWLYTYYLPGKSDFEELDTELLLAKAGERWTVLRELQTRIGISR